MWKRCARRPRRAAGRAGRARARARRAPQREPEAARPSRPRRRARSRPRAPARTPSARFAALGMAIDRFEALPGRDDVVGRLAGTGGGRSLILNGHVDVVPAGDADGLAARSLGRRASRAAAVGPRLLRHEGRHRLRRRRAARPARLGIRLPATSCSSRSSTRRRAGRDARALERGHLADAAIVLEPTASEIVTVEGGLEWLRVVVRGRTGHSRRPLPLGPRRRPRRGRHRDREGRQAAAAVGELERYWGVHKVHPLMPRGITTINPGVIAGGSGGGVDGLPNGMIGVLQLGRLLRARALAEVPAERARRRRARRVRGATSPASRPPIPGCASIRPRSSGALAASPSRPPRWPPDHPFVTSLAGAFRTVAGEPRLGGFEAVSDLAWLAQAGMPACSTAPGTSRRRTPGRVRRRRRAGRGRAVVALALCDWCGWLRRRSSASPPTSPTRAPRRSSTTIQGRAGSAVSRWRPPTTRRATSSRTPAAPDPVPARRRGLLPARSRALGGPR